MKRENHPIFQCPLCLGEPSVSGPPIAVTMVHSPKPVVFSDWFDFADYVKQRGEQHIVTAIVTWEYIR